MKKVILGYLGEEIITQDEEDPFCSKIGGKPRWFHKKLPNPLISQPHCNICNSPLFLIIQAYAPLSWINSHRIIYIFACNNENCSNKKEGWCAWRFQIPLNEEEIKNISNQQPILQEEENENWGDNGSGWLLENQIINPSIFNNYTQNNNDNQKNKENNNLKKEYYDLIFKPYYIEVENEPSKKMFKDNNIHRLIEQYKNIIKEDEEENWSNEQYESSKEKIFLNFQKRIERSPEQCIRYCFNGKPLWISQDIPDNIPNCSSCGSERVFELQIMPTLISLHGLQLSDKIKKQEKIEFGVVTLFSCSKSCNFFDKENIDSFYYKEWIYVQKVI